MSVAAHHRTVSLWPLNPPARSGPARPGQDPATDPLAAITSRYRRGRAGIIAGTPAAPTHLPTVPVALLPQATRPAVPQTPPADPAPTFWSRLVRSRRPSPRGRHASAGGEPACAR